MGEVSSFHTDIPVLQVPPRSLLGFDDGVALLDEVLDEHFGGHGDGEGGVVGAGADVRVDVYYFFDAGDWEVLGVVVSWGVGGYVRDGERERGHTGEGNGACRFGGGGYGGVVVRHGCGKEGEKVGCEQVVVDVFFLLTLIERRVNAKTARSPAL